MSFLSDAEGRCRAPVDCEEPPRYSTADLTSRPARPAQPQSEEFPSLERHLTCFQFSGSAEPEKTGERRRPKQEGAPTS